jgi:hypothetical protein
MHPGGKTCSSCGRAFGLESVVCVPCEEVLENGHYLRWITVTSVMAIGAVVWMMRSGILDGFSIAQAFKIEAALLLVCYPAAKIVQKWREPERPVLREMGSVFAGRSDRIMVLCLLAFALLLAIGPLRPTPRAAGAREGAWILDGISWFVALGGLAACVAIVIDQGKSFFDLRIRNTYVERFR